MVFTGLYFCHLWRDFKITWPKWISHSDVCFTLKYPNSGILLNVNLTHWVTSCYLFFLSRCMSTNFIKGKSKSKVLQSIILGLFGVISHWLLTFLEISHLRLLRIFCIKYWNNARSGTRDRPPSVKKESRHITFTVLSDIKSNQNEECEELYIDNKSKLGNRIERCKTVIAMLWKTFTWKTYSTCKKCS